MPVHDWTKVDAGVFHHFHQRWILAIAEGLNDQLLPPDFYALAEQVVAGPIPDVVTLERIAADDDSAQPPGGSPPGVALLDAPPKTRYSHEADLDRYAAKATRVAIRHVSGDRVVGYIEVVSPGNKHSEVAMRSFIDKLANALRDGLHLLVIDLHPPTRRDPRGVHAQFWTTYFGDEGVPGVDADHPLGMAAYCGGFRPKAFFEPFAVGDTLIDMPAFLTADRYVNVPLEETYAEAWQSVPRRWRAVIE